MMKVLVTGGSRGIGQSTVGLFVSRGYQVLMPTRGELDLSNSKSVDEYLYTIRNEQIDSIINNAGINDINLLENVSDEQIECMMQVNFTSPTRLLRGLVPQIKKSQAGRIVNIGSIWAVVSKRGRSIYSATKNGMHGITNALALELAEYGVLVNTVCPGFTLTELTQQNNTSEQISEISKQIPLGRMADSEEIARLIYFLGSTENTYITGQKITIDGGFTIQ